MPLAAPVMIAIGAPVLVDRVIASIKYLYCGKIFGLAWRLNACPFSLLDRLQGRLEISQREG